MTAELRARIEALDEKTDRLQEETNKLNEFVDGNGREGAKVRLDRLERMAASQVKMGWILVVALVGAFASVLAAVISGFGGGT